MKDKRLLFGIVVAFVFLFSIGFTYSYFILNVEGNKEAKKIEVTTTNLYLVYTDGPEIKATAILPGWSTTKVVSVENQGDSDTAFAFSWASINNEIERDELFVSATCVSTVDGVATGTCADIPETLIPFGTASSMFAEHIAISPNYKYTYTITIRFKEMNKEQNYNQGKNFAAKINVLDSLEYVAYSGIVQNNNGEAIPNATVEVHSDVISTTSDGNGFFAMSGITPGDHTLIIKDGDNNQILSQAVKFARLRTTSSIDGTNINVKLEERFDKKILVKIDTTTNTLSSMSFVSLPVVTFDVGEHGTLENNTLQLTNWNTYGELPTPSVTEGNYFIGWFTEDGIEVESSTPLRNYSDHVLHANYWTGIS